MTRTATAFLLAAVAAASAPAQPIHFTDVTQHAGIDHVHVDPQYLMGAGCAFLDYDGDGWMDVLFSGSALSPSLYRNRGDATFEDATEAAGLLPIRGRAYGMGAACADYDNDGDTDVYLVAMRGNVLLRNDGDGSFTDVTDAAGVRNYQWSTGAAFGDYDGDGLLDLYVGNYIKQLSYPNHVPFPNTLYHNEGDGTFRDVTLGTGVAGAGTTLAVSWSDYDGDGDVDLIVANDFGAFVQPNRLYRNDGPPTAPGHAEWKFTEVSAAAGSDIQIYCMGIAAGDYDRDLDFDYYFTNLGRNVLLGNQGGGVFADVTTACKVEGTYDPYQAPLFATSWGCGFHDFDRDGFVDLYVSNGHIPAAPEIANSVDTPKFLYRNDGAGAFQDVSLAAGVEDKKIGRGCAFADYDNDGDVDILQANVNARPVLFRNDSANASHWLHLRPRGVLSNRDGAGTRIVADIGSAKLLREANANYSFESASDPGVQFGLAGEREVKALTARWLSGVEHTLVHVGADQSLPLVEPRTTIAGVEFPAVLTAGTSALVKVTIQNHATVAVTGQLVLELRAKGGVFPVDGVAFSTAPNAAATASIAFVAPPAGVGHAVELVLGVVDPAGGIDQRTAVVLLQP